MVFIDSKDKNTYLMLQGLKKFEIHINLLLNKLKKTMWPVIVKLVYIQRILIK